MAAAAPGPVLVIGTGDTKGTELRYVRDRVAAPGPAHLHVVLAPGVGESGYEAVDVAGEEPWSTLH